MKDDTPYRERPQGQIAAEQRCMAAIFAHATPVDFIFEAFGGLGNTAQIMHERFAQAVILASDLDAGCVDIYNEKFKSNHANCVQSDALALLRTVQNFPHWGASLDFNRFTIMDVFGRPETKWKTNLIEAIIERRPDWIQITDSAARYLHFHYQRYGCKLDISDYIYTLSQAMNERWGLNYVTHCGFYAANYLLLTPAR